MLVYAAPNIERVGVVAGFTLGITAGSLVPTITRGVLFAQDTMYRPAADPELPAAPAGARSWLWYHTGTGFYWTATFAATAAGDAFLGWVRTSDTEVVAVSRQVFWIDASSGVGALAGGGGGNGGSGGGGAPGSADREYGPAPIIQEAPAGVRNGRNKTFTLTKPAARSAITGQRVVLLKKNGVALTPFEYDTEGWASLGGDYVCNGRQLLLAVAPRGADGDEPADQLLAEYWPAEEVDEALLQTGVWLARPLLKAQAANNDWDPTLPENAGDFIGADTLGICRTVVWKDYPEPAWTNFEEPSDGYDDSLLERVSLCARYSLTPSITVNGLVYHWFVPHQDKCQDVVAEAGEGHSAEVIDGTSGQVGHSRTNHAMVHDLYAQDLQGSTIPVDLMTAGAWWYHGFLYDSMPSGIEGGVDPEPDTAHPVALLWHDMYLALFRKAIRINCGGGQTDLFPARNTWLADACFTGGEAATLQEVTPDLSLYNTVRRGQAFRYTFGRSPYADQQAYCKYRIKFYFKEWLMGVDGAGQRVFSVSVNGTSVIAGLDLFDAHGSSAHEPELDVVVPSFPDGRIVIDFEASAGEAIVNGISVTPRLMEE